MKRAKDLYYLSLLAALFISILMGYAELSGKLGIVCRESSCLKVQSSSFTEVLGLPITSIAIILLILTIALGPESSLGQCILSILFGSEAYMFFIQWNFIEAFCRMCVVFFLLIILAFITTGKAKWKLKLYIATVSFLLAHFIFFYPKKPDNIPKESIIFGKRVITATVYSSPSCPHCREVIDYLKELSRKECLLITEKYVSLGPWDRKLIEAKLLGKKRSSISKRILDVMLWKNKADVRKIEGKVALPIIVLKKGNKRLVVTGWNQKSAKIVESFLEKKDEHEKVLAPISPFPWETKKGICEEGICE